MTSFTTSLPTHARAFSSEFVKGWIVRQFEAWKFRKRLEPGGMAHPRVVEFDTLPPSDQVFLIWITRGILDYLRFAGKSSLVELRQTGKALLQGQIAQEIGSWKDPTQGVLMSEGGPVVLRPQLANWIAYSHHELWIHCRERSWLMPYEDLWQKKGIAAHKHWQLHAPDDSWFGDTRFAYGLAMELGKLSESEFKPIYDSAAETNLPLAPFSVAVAADSMRTWRDEYLFRSESWRRKRLNEGSLPEVGVHYEQMEIGDRVFKGELSYWILDFLRIYGKDALIHLREVGKLAAGERRESKISDNFDPFEGVPLRSGLSARIDRGLLRSAAEDYWGHMAMTAEWTRTLPYRKAHRATPKPHELRDSERIYGIADALGAQSEESFADLIAISV